MIKVYINLYTMYLKIILSTTKKLKYINFKCIYTLKSNDFFKFFRKFNFKYLLLKLFEIIH
jgi:hypothetical protein